MCDVCGKALPAVETVEPVEAGFGMLLGNAVRQHAPDGWFGISRVVGTEAKTALCCSTDCVMRFVHQPRPAETTT